MQCVSVCEEKQLITCACGKPGSTHLLCVQYQLMTYAIHQFIWGGCSTPELYVPTDRRDTRHIKPLKQI